MTHLDSGSYSQTPSPLTPLLKDMYLWIQIIFYWVVVKRMDDWSGKESGIFWDFTKQNKSQIEGVSDLQLRANINVQTACTHLSGMNKPHSL